MTHQKVVQLSVLKSWADVQEAGKKLRGAAQKKKSVVDKCQAEIIKIKEKMADDTEQYDIDIVHWEDALHAFLKKRFKVDHRRFLKREKAQYVIEAIKDMYLRKILVAGCEAIGHNGEKVENQLIELYRFIAGHFTTEELIAVLTMHVYCNPQISNDSKIMLRTMGGMQFRSLINA